MTKRRSAGFSLIELMVVVGIIGILAGIAIPQYQSYTVRSQLVEALTLAREVQTDVTAYHKRFGRFPKNNNAAGAPEAKFLIGNYVKRIEVENGALHVTLGNKVNNNLQGKILSLRPLVVTGSPASPISWSCGNASAPTGMQSVGENKTTVSKEYLPYPCREDF